MFGFRSDGDRVKDLSPTRAIMPYLMPTRTESANGRTTEVSASLAGLRHRLSFHAQLQEARLFPCCERAEPIPNEPMECWSDDAIGLLNAAEDLRASDLDGPLGFLRRLRHLIDEVEEHLAAEVRLFAGFTQA